MNPLKRIIERLKAPRSPENLEAEQEAARARDRVDTTRIGARTPAGENYQSGRGNRQN